MTFRPLQVLPVVPVDSYLQVRIGADTITVKNHVDAIWTVLRYTNGHRDIDEVIDKAAEASGQAAPLLEAVVGDLERLGVLMDSRTLGTSVIAYSDNPMPFPSDMRISEFVAYERSDGWEATGERVSLGAVPVSPYDERRSCRGYQDAPVPMETLATVLRHTTYRPASAGALYPIRLGLILNRPVGDLSTGIYHYDPVAHALIQGTAASREEVRYALNREDGVHNAPAVIVVAGDMDRQTKKYSNRGWRYTLIEAGIATERILNAARNAGLGSLVFGGYDDVAMSRLLFGADTPQVRTLVTIALGKPTTKPLPDVDLEQLHDQLDDEFVGEGRIVEGTGVTDLWRKPGDLSFHQVLATIRSENEDVQSPAEHRTCGGTGASITAARAKAIVECVERYASGNMRVDRIGPATEVNPGFDPYVYAPFTAEQIKAHHYLTKFDPHEPLQWVVAHDLYSGAETFVPVEFVYYPLSTKRLGRQMLTAANSSGIASHTDSTEAVHRALFELIERHSVLTSWHTQLKPISVPPDALTDYLNNRRIYWHTQGYELRALDYSTEGVPTAGIAIGSGAKFPAFAFGSAAAPTWEAAVVKALHEAEVGMAGHRGLKEDPIPPNEIITPIHHGRFHAYDPQRTAWTFLKSAETPNTYTTPHPLENVAQVVERYRPLSVRIDSPDPIHTYRVLSPHVFPISFGASLEHRPGWSTAPDLPHFIA